MGHSTWVGKDDDVKGGEIAGESCTGGWGGRSSWVIRAGREQTRVYEGQEMEMGSDRLACGGPSISSIVIKAEQGEWSD